jgi:hypothetical protein
MLVWCSNADCDTPLYHHPEKKCGVVTCHTCHTGTCLEHEERGLPQEHVIITTIGPKIVCMSSLLADIDRSTVVHILAAKLVRD